MNAWTSPTFWRLPFESDLTGRSMSSSSRDASAPRIAEVSSSCEAPAK